MRLMRFLSLFFALAVLVSVSVVPAMAGPPISPPGQWVAASVDPASVIGLQSDSQFPYVNTNISVTSVSATDTNSLFAAEVLPFSGVLLPARSEPVNTVNFMMTTNGNDFGAFPAAPTT